jgi:hypothetical protein
VDPLPVGDGEPSPNPPTAATAPRSPPSAPSFTACRQLHHSPLPSLLAAVPSSFSAFPRYDRGRTLVVVAGHISSSNINRGGFRKSYRGEVEIRHNHTGRWILRTPRKPIHLSTRGDDRLPQDNTSLVTVTAYYGCKVTYLSYVDKYSYPPCILLF